VKLGEVNTLSNVVRKAKPIKYYSACVKISVVLCTYADDMYEHFTEAADSVLSQTYDDVELVVVVDGTPGVYDRVREEYGERENVVIECNDENQGLLRSRNRGAKIAAGDVVAFIDDDAVADSHWIERLANVYEERDAIAVGGRMVPAWVAGKPQYLPKEFYWLVGVTHRGFAEQAGEVRNTFGSNISFRKEIFEALDGFDTDIGGRKGDKNLQGGETELCARMYDEYGQGVWYEPEAEVAHKVFSYRTDIVWLFDRAMWQGYSKRAMSQLVEGSSDQEQDFGRRLILEFGPKRVASLLRKPSWTKVCQLVMLVGLTVTVGVGFLYGAIKY